MLVVIPPEVNDPWNASWLFSWLCDMCGTTDVAGVAQNIMHSTDKASSSKPCKQLDPLPGKNAKTHIV